MMSWAEYREAWRRARADRPSLTFLHQRFWHHIREVRCLGTAAQVQWAFWRHDRFPFVLSGEVEELLPQGEVRVKGYRGYKFKYFYLAEGEHGRQLNTLVRQIKHVYGIQEECARSAAGRVAHELLEGAGLPVDSLPLLRMGWQGEAYADLFRQLMKRETGG